MKRDWFSIVATDLFCNVLCAVIIFDAVSPKETAAPSSPLQFDVIIDRGDAQPCAAASGILVAFDDMAGRRFLSYDLPAQVTAEPTICRHRYFVPSADLQSQTPRLRIIVAEQSKPSEIRVRFSGMPETPCPDPPRCVVYANDAVGR